jgi:5'(3')-deoxyribonucleotidase
MNERKSIFIDMDGVIADWVAGVKSYPPEMWENDVGDIDFQKVDGIKNLFRNLPVMDGAINAVNKLWESDKYDLFIATTAPWDCPTSLTDKRLWLEDYFGDIFYKRMVTTHRKDLLIGDYLIDDRLVNGAAEFSGEHIHFGSEKYPNWDSVLKYLL